MAREGSRDMFIRWMSHTGRIRHFSSAMVAWIAANACVRFGYDVMDSSTHGDPAGTTTAGSPTRGGSVGTYGAVTSAGALAGGATSLTTATHQAEATQGGSTPLSALPGGGFSGTLSAPSGGGATTLAVSTSGASISGGYPGTIGTGSAEIHAGAGGTTAGDTIGTSANAGGAPGSGGAAVGGSSGGSSPTTPSCAAQLVCQAESCCNVIGSPAGSFNRGVNPTYSVTLHTVYLDQYEVTVGRFRAFLAAYDGWRAASYPSPGQGAYQNPTLAGSGWDSAWNAQLPASAAVFEDASHLKSCGTRSTWTATVGTGTPNPENYPINCVSWYEAFAFCIWDGGRLATEAEWQYVAGGGTENRVYPWGNSPSADPLPANYVYNRNSPFVEVGSEPNGRGRWGHSDLAGGMSEWCLDWYALDYPSACNDCANLISGSDRVNRGGTWLNTSMALQVGSRGYAAPTSRFSFTGLRCARNGP